MGEQAKVLQKGKITIPADIRQRLGINEGDYVRLEIVGNKLMLLPPNTVSSPTEVLSGLAEGVQVAESLKRELKRAAAGRMRRKVSRVVH